MRPTLIQLSVSDGGMPKRAVKSARVTIHGIEGDRQIDLRYHGGDDRAVCLYSEELYDWLRDHGIDLPSGHVGENFTIRGIDLDALQIGDRLRVGECLIEITDVRTPCRKLNGMHPKLLKTITGHSGWLAKVVEEAVVKPGDAVEVVARV